VTLAEETLRQVRTHETRNARDQKCCHASSP
jgi:hypothetical protein